jgi:type II secretory pathway component PulJ
MDERARSERGNTVMELVVVVAILAVVGTMIMQSMLASVQTSASGAQRSYAVADTRTALERIERDIRAANPIEVAATTAAYDTAIRFSIYCSDAGVGSCGTDNLRQVTWRVVDNRLERLEGSVVGFEIGPSGPAGLPESQQRNAVINPSTRPVFKYYDANGDLLPTAGADALPPEQFRLCAKTVEVTLVTVAEPGKSSTVDLTTSAALRNYYEVDGC